VFRRAGERAPERLVPYDVDRPAVEAARRDPRDFEPLYRKYVGQVYSFAVYELHDHHAAEDLTEQVFLQALSALPRFEERGSGELSTFRVWLFQIARNALANERRGRQRHPRVPLDAALELPAMGPDPASQSAERDVLARALRAIARLPGDRRRALVLRFVEEMTTQEIAGVMGRSEGAVRVLIHRALRAVADELRRD
jgi:RNA polymerase sigma-70 factor, ECF subfamily